MNALRHLGPAADGTVRQPVPPPWGADPALSSLVVAEDDLQAVVRTLGERISADHSGRSGSGRSGSGHSDDALLCVAVLKGAFLFMADLARSITCPVEFDFMAVSSYGAATKTSGVVRIVKDLDADLSGRHVIVVEDVVDSGLTLSWLRKNLWARSPASLEVCALLVKDGQQRRDPDLRYEGFRIPPDFVVGYGLDADQRYRNLPFICTYAPVSPAPGGRSGPVSPAPGGRSGPVSPAPGGRSGPVSPAPGGPGRC